MSSLMDLNDRLFRELDRLDKVDGSDADALSAEVERARAVGTIAKNIVDNAHTILNAEQMRQNSMTGTAELVTVPRLLSGDGAPTVDEMREAL